MNFFQFFITCKRTNKAYNVTHYVKLGKKRRKSSKRNYYIISQRVILKAIIIHLQRTGTQCRSMRRLGESRSRVHH